MEVLSGIVNFITTYIFNQPFILLSLVAMLRSEEHTSELQSLPPISYAVFCLKKSFF